MRKWLSVALVLALAGCVGSEKEDVAAVPKVSVSSSDQRPAKLLFGPVATPSSHTSESFGSYSKGCLAGAVALPESGPTWQAMRLSRNRNWGQPVLVDFLEDLSRKAAAQPGWKGIYIGDMSQPRGGPMSSGHASHQIGLDADIWMLPATQLDLTRAERESLSSISTRRAAGAYVNDNWTRAHHEILKAAASDPRVARIFVFPGAKVQMCKDETGDKSWLRKIRPWWGHHYHFHVRLNCPKGDSSCVDQAPPPPGDGCDDAQDWVNNILNPPPPDPNAKPAKPKPPITLATLPAQCSAVLSSR
ncbi:penicillin-insensitive murein endopeptidase [Celeribacter halophilus]|uniref:Penicillin-insensitive murein endopeptidase n=1 Tax=Celeribacter halophilus TaxID=576117 RepID=A0A1I3TWL0_9RHOB|nr:penicillin-insensitive murein endopeptidase [Celeribacter halophilus]PZX10775.1 penicillin-insensitive murein endopeptidase [Celeribacter halophilus]SFJ74853.1 penicillin-insensitive murein endopeptidase [Celeribacter halophilus]